MKRILLLGATGSIGLQTIDVIEQHPDLFELVGVVAGNKVQQLNEIIEKHPSIQVVGIGNEQFKDQIHHKKVYSGNHAMVDCIENCDYDLLVNAVVGFRGLKPTLVSLKKGKDVALANKESLVAGGMLVRQTLKETNTKLYPIDSEHSAIFQCLQGNDISQVKRLIITASGGSFRDKTREELKEVTVEQTLKHPNWSMGKRITVDSATMVNKGFEVIEAHFLFGLDYDQIDTVLHQESIVHSMVEYIDHAIMAQMGSADMRLPIQYAIQYPDRLSLKEEHPFDATKTINLHFKEMDFERYPMLRLAYEVGRKEGNLGAVFNGADEQAVELFLEEKISFLQIEESIEKAIQQAQYIEYPSYQQLEESDLWAREFVKSLWD
ncbi:1-deoxy-D-xylulose-5-phosphate reductoisomerase [Floccifex sp.]|uniref:1-deoxy-D-xylulose-5-phosphate reductoisomerase n=1 Tax=Floccifex sp. TaxID=2815810 RepID=UPI003F08B3DC